MAKRLRGIESIIPHYPPDNDRGAYAPAVWYGDDTLNATDGPWYDAVPGSIYIHQQSTTANVYIKRADTGASSDWTSFYGGSTITQADGAASAAQKVVTVDSTTGFLGGCYVEYALATGIIERNVVATVDSGTQLTFTTNIGTGGIANNALIAVIPAGTYNATRGVFNVLDYGATGDGVTDDTTKVQAAITAASTAANGEVVFPVGTYKLTGQIQISGDNVTLRGQGIGSILAFSSALAGNAGIYVENTSAADANIEDVQIRDLTITLAHADSIAIQYDRAVNPLLFNVVIEGTNTSQTGIIMDGEGDQTGTWGGGLRVLACRLRYLKYGVKVQKRAGTCNFTDSWFSGKYPTPIADSIGIHFDTNAGTNTIIGCDIESFAKAVYDGGIGNRIIGNRFEFNTANIVQAETVTGGFYIASNFYVDGSNTITRPYYGIQLDPQYPPVVGQYLAAAADVKFILKGIEIAKSTRYEAHINSATPALIMSGQDTGSTNAFGEVTAGPEANVACGAWPLKIGTVGDTALDFYIASLKAGGFDTSFNLAVYPAGDGGHDNGHLILGNYHLWVDSTGDLRIKSGAPTGDTDGVVVGSQS